MTSPKDPKQRCACTHTLEDHDTVRCGCEMFTSPISSSRLGDEDTVKESLTVGDNHIGDANEKVLITPNSRELDPNCDKCNDPKIASQHWVHATPNPDSEGELVNEIEKILSSRVHTADSLTTMFAALIHRREQGARIAELWACVYSAELASDRNAIQYLKDRIAAIEQHRTKQ